MRFIRLINSRFLLFSVLIYLISMPKLDTQYMSLVFLHIFYFLAFYFVLSSQLFKHDNYYSSNRLLWLIFSFSLFFIVSNNIISYIYNKDYFVFSFADAGTYHFEALEMNKLPIGQGINLFMSNWSFEDIGAVLVISTLYRLVESNLIVNAFYLILSLFTGLGLYKIGRYLIPSKYAFFASLTFSISSFFIWFNSSGLKESVMIFLVTYSFLHYYNFKNKKSIKQISLLIFYLLLLMLFRPAVTFLILSSILVSYILGRKQSYTELVFTASIVGVLFFGIAYIDYSIARYTGGGLTHLLIEKESSGALKGSLVFVYLVNVIAGLIGPFPTISPNSNVISSFYAPGLIYKILISVPFIFGIFHIFKRNIVAYYPIVFFVLFEIVSLIFILQTLELRKSMPHLPFIYIIGFGFLSKFDKSNIPPQKKRAFERSLNAFFILIFFSILFWNSRN